MARGHGGFVSFFVLLLIFIRGRFTTYNFFDRKICANFKISYFVGNRKWWSTQHYHPFPNLTFQILPSFQCDFSYKRKSWRKSTLMVRQRGDLWWKYLKQRIVMPSCALKKNFLNNIPGHVREAPYWKRLETYINGYIHGLEGVFTCLVSSLCTSVLHTATSMLQQSADLYTHTGKPTQVPNYNIHLIKCRLVGVIFTDKDKDLNRWRHVGHILDGIFRSVIHI